MTDNSADRPINGLSDGFEAYLSPVDGDYSAVLASGLVVLDTNVLLNLYRFEEEARTDLLRVLARLGDSVWIPHQAAQEFWRNREHTILTRRNSHRDAVKSLERPTQAVRDVVTRWAHTVGLSHPRLAELHGILDETFDQIRDAIGRVPDNDPLHGARDTNKDPVLATLQLLLKGRVGPPLSQEDLAKALKEADRRAVAEIPPGYKDRDKPDHRGAGDYLVWEQAVREAVRRSADVLFVTSDVKEDWWRKVRDSPAGPRVELVNELRDRAGTRLFMLQPQDLLQIAGRQFEVSVRPESAGEIAHTARTELAEGNSRRDRIRLYLATALSVEIPMGVSVDTDVTGSGSAWDILLTEGGRTLAGVWIYDPVKPFNDLVTDSVSSTGMAQVKRLRAQLGPKETAWLACVVDLSTFLDRMTPERDVWRRSNERAHPDRGETAFKPYIECLLDAGFDMVEIVMEGGDSTEAAELTRLDHVVARVRDQVAQL